MTLGSRLKGWLPRSLAYEVPGRVPESDDVIRRRRRRVTLVGVVGAATLGTSLSTRPGSPQFYTLTLTTAGVWTVGALLSGPLHQGWIESLAGHRRRPVVVPVLTGAAAFGGLMGAAVVARRIPVLDAAVRRVLRFADEGDAGLVTLTTLANGVAEEVFFRGALYEAVAQNRPVLWSTVAYTAATASTRNPALTLAGAAMGTLFALQRRATGGIQAPALTHLAWSVLVLRYLPRVFGEPGVTARGS
ncbi:hypothetical protein CLV56_3016 [Mumia flava]|uniref:CAAX prenyl protease 2/Lysostaphin resistance protein A-like domain-containing protein n=1 Tax=Mumia flava TaxID=1348852 RepID=A0A0B2B9B4_9ACTN|nr:type II CAAX endopeptidase family protein [Mumia flava]PJJ53526.1 hypothetical protein CLV56_3016 [Mumia flava]